jgi:benzoyl-CoA reductase/2-hydroxyglutaryl-CoA dehydratase subunit BcrC/BadD/HgdB
MDNIIEEISHLHKNRLALLKATNQRSIGWVSIYTPEEIVYAAGMIPYRITGETRTEISKAGGYMHRNICPYVLSCLEEGLDKVYDFSEGVIIANACDARRGLYDVWKYFKETDFVHILDLPKAINAATKDYFAKEIEHLKETLENRYHCQIQQADFKAAISLCNETRQLLQSLYDLRKRATPPITGVQALNIVRASMTGLKKEFNFKMSQLLEQLETSDLDNDNDVDKHRVMVCGSFFDHTHIIELIEQMDAVVVCEDMSNGIKYFEGKVDTQTDPVTALAEYYLEKATCARMLDSEKRFNHLWQLIEDYNVESVIYITLKFCDSNLIDFYYQKKRLAEKDIPVLFIETERIPTNLGQIRTRIQAFLEARGWL